MKSTVFSTNKHNNNTCLRNNLQDARFLNDIPFFRWFLRVVMCFVSFQDLEFIFIDQTTARFLTHWGRVTHICVSKLTIIGSDNGLSPGRRQAIIWTNAGILSIRNLGTNFSEIFSEIHAFSFKKMHWKMSSAKWRPLCLGLNVLKTYHSLQQCPKGEDWHTTSRYPSLRLHIIVNSMSPSHLGPVSLRLKMS